MKKIFLLFICLSVSFQSTNAQRLELFGGWTYTSFGYRVTDHLHYRASMHGGRGYCLGISMDDIKIVNKIRLRFSVKLDNYKGDLYSTDGGNAAYTSTTAQFEKNSLAIGFYPLNAVLLKNLRLSLGGEFNIFLNDKTEGYRYFSYRLGNSGKTPISEVSGGIYKKSTWGFSGRIGYDIKILNKWFLVPQYMFYLSFKNEFQNIELQNAKTFRHYFGLGIVREL